MTEFNTKKNIQNVDDYIDYANSIFEAFLETFTKENGLKRDVEEGDYFEDDEPLFMYTTRGGRLAERMRDKLHSLGIKHFPESEFDIEIESNLYREF